MKSYWVNGVLGCGLLFWLIWGLVLRCATHCIIQCVNLIHIHIIHCRPFLLLLHLYHMKQEKIREKIHEQLPLLKAKYHVKKIGIFGSFARNEQKKGSDIDILVEFETPVGFFEFIRLENFLSHTLRKKVDLISKKAVKQAIKKEIIEEVQYV